MQEPQHTKKHRKWRWQAVILFLSLCFGVWFLASRFMPAVQAFLIVLFGLPLLWLPPSGFIFWLGKREKNQQYRRRGYRSLGWTESAADLLLADPSTQELDRLRKRLRNRKLLFRLLYVLFSVCFWLALRSLMTFTVALPIFLFSTAILLKPVTFLSDRMTNAPKEAYRTAYKQIVVERALGSQFTAPHYSPGWGLSAPFYSGIQSLYAWNNVHIRSEDCIAAQYKDIGFEQAEICVTGGTEGRNDLLFRGRWMSFAFNKQFQSNCLVVQRGGSDSLRPKSNDLTYQSVEMESSAFCERFLVLAQKPHEAFYLLTPQLMEQLQCLSDGIDGGLILCFVENRLYVAIRSYDNAYEPPRNCFKPVNLYEAVGRTQEEIDLITRLIDALRLDNDLFLQEL